MNFFETTWSEMIKGNFSFAILLIGIAQVVLMAINLHRTKK